MKNFSWKPLIPHFIAIGVFLIVALIYCKPALEGKVIQQHDITQWKAMAKDIHDYKAKHGEAPLWTQSMFSGMPGYMISTKTNNVVPYYFQEALSLFLPKPFNFFFLACICFYIFCLVLRVNPYVAMIGALTYAYATYNPVIIGAGHDTKMLSIALMPGLIGGLILIYERRYWLGAGLTAAFAGALISVNHLQITYYALIIAFIMSIGYAVRWIMTKQWKHMIVATVFALVSGLVGVLSNAVTLFTTYEYSKETIRGGSQLADAKSNVGKNGLNEDYALSYSMTKAEPMVMMFPRMFGGSSMGLEINPEESKAYEKVSESPAPQIAQQLQYSYYWGGIGGTNGPPYVGAIICFLALVGFFVLNNKHKWWALGAIVFAILLSWGSFFPEFNRAMLEYLPFYNKFRAPSMTIVIPTFLLGMLAVLTLDKLVFHTATANTSDFIKRYKKGLLLVAGVFGIALLMYMSLDYVGSEKSYLENIDQFPEQIKSGIKAYVNGLKEDRQQLFLMDIFRSLLFVAIAAGALWLSLKKKITSTVALIVIGLFAFIDLISIDAKYLTNEMYQDKEEYETSNFDPRPEDQQIMQDKGNYRVLDLRYGGIQGAFNQGAMTAYFHKSIGGYHPAKLSIYQDLIEKQLYKFPNCMPVINMLNTKYVINVGEQNVPQVIPNPSALGPVWFVKNIKWVNDAKEEMAALDSLNPAETVVINKQFNKIASQAINFDSSATIEWRSNGDDHDKMTYHSKSTAPQFAVFSEVYYSKGWKAYIDGKEADYVKANYVLRAMPVPAGEHTIEFRFDPQSHKIGSTVTLICSVLMLALLGFGIWQWYKKKDVFVEEI
jgi:ABC-type multidrug transport system fused ATPase/permease subunit